MIKPLFVIDLNILAFADIENEIIILNVKEISLNS